MCPHRVLRLKKFDVFFRIVSLESGKLKSDHLARFPHNFARILLEEVGDVGRAVEFASETQDGNSILENVKPRGVIWGEIWCILDPPSQLWLELVLKPPTTQPLYMGLYPRVWSDHCHFFLQSLILGQISEPKIFR